MLKGVLFDMDGVLVDTEPEYMRVEVGMCKALGITLTEQKKRIYVGGGPLAMWTDLKKKHGFADDPAELTRKEMRMMDEYYKSGVLLPIEPTVRLLKKYAQAGLKTAVATSSKRENASHVIRRIGLERYVLALASGDMVRQTKPAPDIFLLAAEALGAKPDECVVIEDARNGITAAKKAGMRAVALRSPASAQDLSEADIVVSSLDEVGLHLI